MQRLKVTTILGTRPEIIRLSRVMARLDEYVDHRIVHTGQNYDYELNEVFFEELGVRAPDNFLSTGGGTLGETLGRILIESEKELVEHRPDAVLVLGDTNSAISAMMARRMKIPVYHMEAGNRSFDRNVPEETNRRLVDHISDFNLVYTEHARRHLLSEGLTHRRIYLTGTPMREVLDHYRDRIEESVILSTLDLKTREYIVVSLHREENVDNSRRLAVLLQALNTLADEHSIPIIVSTHPRTRKRLEAIGESRIDPRIRFLRPFGFHDYNHLQMNAYCVISDSGTVAEEASILGFPAISPRDSIERPEGLDTGCIIVTGVDVTAVREGVIAANRLFHERSVNNAMHSVPSDYLITNTSERVVSLIIGTARLSNAWDNIRLNDLG